MKTVICFFVLTMGVACAFPQHGGAQDGPYRFVKEIPIAGDTGFDYLSVDPMAHRLFVSHGTRIVVVDIKDDKIEGEITDVTGVHGLTLGRDLGRGFSANGGENTVGIVDLSTLRTLQKVKTGTDPDTVAYDPIHHNVYAFGKGDGSATVFDAKSGEIVGTFPLGGIPQATVVDAQRGRVYVNLQDKNAIAVIDTASHQLIATWSIEPGENQSGLAIDTEHQRLFVGCRNKLMVMVDATNGKVLAQVPIGAGVDASGYDPGTKLAFSSSGGDATVTIAREDSPTTLTKVQTLATKPGARTMAVDPSTHRIYLAVPDFEPLAPGQTGRPKAIPGTFRVLVYEMADEGGSAKETPRTSVAGEAGPQQQSRITGISVSGTQSTGTFGRVPYIRAWGTLTGVVAPGENVHGLAALPHDRDGNYKYESGFEIIAPAKPGLNSVIIVEGENRGSPVFLNSLLGIAASGAPSAATYASGFGNGFLFENATSYARVQWQTGIASAVPEQAEGIGEVIVRDFGRWLAGRTKIETNPQFDPGTYPTLILSGTSLGGFFVNTFIAEGFNTDPLDNKAVFDGAIAVDGTGNWLALNQLAAANGIDEIPYLMPNGKPLGAASLLTRPQSDPYYVDIANYTDFYRLRASLTDRGALPARMRRYDWPSPHGAAPIDQSSFGARAGRCNGGVLVDLNPISYAPYLRAVLLELERTLGVKSASGAPALPATTLFKLGPAPAIAANFNPLPGVTLEVPVTDADDQPAGGVRFPEVEHPIGRPAPVSLPPVVTTSIDGTCGNLGEWQQFTAAQLMERYGNQLNYLNLYAASLDKLIAEGYLLASDRAQMLKIAALLYSRRPSR